MNSLQGLLASCGLAATLAAVSFLLLRRPLERLLAELCGNSERGLFWSGFTGLALVLTTLLGCLMAFPLGDPAAWDGAGIARSVLLGLRAGMALLLLVLTILGFILGRAIARFEHLRRTGKPRGGDLPSWGSTS